MGATRTWTARRVSVATALLAAAQLAVLLQIDTAYGQITVSALVLATTLAAAKQWREEGVESRTLVVLVAAASAAGFVLVATAGLPGAPARLPDVRALIMMLLAVSVLSLMAIDRPRLRAAARRRSPYAP